MKRRFGLKWNRPPTPPRNLPAKIDPKAKTDPCEMNPQMYEWIKDYIDNGGDKSRINEMIYGKKMRGGK